MSTIAFIVIGRNEGERLKRCLNSLQTVSETIVYVDSGSIDGSREYALGCGVTVVDLDTTTGFTMARGRNAGLKRLLEISPETQFVHFIDGDCELIADWLPRAINFAIEHPDVAAVCGRRRERYPEASPYNLMCEIEWNTPIGEAQASGGDVLMSVPALLDVGGFNEQLIAFEEPDLCRRLRNHGWKIWRLDADMTRHDANILHFLQWWKRHERTGYGSMVITQLCRSEGDKAGVDHFGDMVMKPRKWVFAVVVIVLLGAPLALYLGGLLALILLIAGIGVVLGLQSLRIALNSRLRCPDFRAALLYGLFTMIAKIPQVLGQLRYLMDRVGGRKAVIIEYK